MNPIYDAYKVWVSYYTKDRTIYWSNDIKATFANFLGCKVNKQGHLTHRNDIRNLNSWKLTPDMEAKMNMLRGPHARTLVKAYFLLHPELPTPPNLYESEEAS